MDEPVPDESATPPGTPAASGGAPDLEQPREELQEAASARVHRVRYAVLGVLVAVGAVVALYGRFGTAPEGLKPEAVSVAGVMIIMASLWVLEGLPLAATALLPMAAFPLLSVSPAKTVAKAYTSSIIMLLMGGFFLAKALERWEVPQRLAQRVERWASGSPTRLLYGLMGATGLLSMWLSNTATTLVMVTVATAAIHRARESERNDPADVRRFAIALLLGVAYAANVGGLFTPVGTAPNAIFLGMAEGAGIPSISFARWMILTAPVVFLLLPLMAVLLARVLSPFPPGLDLGHADVESASRPLSKGGRRALALFGVTAFLWVFRKEVDLEVLRIPGWASALGLEGHVDDGAVAMIGALAMFATPSGEGTERVLSWDVARGIPWYLILLFGGGLALADAFGTTGLSAWLGDQLVWMKGGGSLLIVFTLCFGMSLLTEVTSNTATTTLLLPVLGAAAVSLEVSPLLLMFPATLCASAAFILPISTPPNAIAAGAADITIPEMARVGVWLNMLAVVLVTATALWWLPLWAS